MKSTVFQAFIFMICMTNLFKSFMGKICFQNNNLRHSINLTKEWTLTNGFRKAFLLLGMSHANQPNGRHNIEVQIGIRQVDYRISVLRLLFAAFGQLNKNRKGIRDIFKENARFRSV
jgi:hypothetical protein